MNTCGSKALRFVMQATLQASIPGALQGLATSLAISAVPPCPSCECRVQCSSCPSCICNGAERSCPDCPTASWTSQLIIFVVGILIGLVARQYIGTILRLRATEAPSSISVKERARIQLLELEQRRTLKDA